MYGDFNEELKFWSIKEIKEIAKKSGGVVTIDKEDGNPIVIWGNTRLVFTDVEEGPNYTLLREEGKWCVSHSEFNEEEI